MKIIPVEDAVGMVLGHDITEIVPDIFKGRAFHKGHVIRQADIEKLLNLGKENIYALELADGLVHENDAAQRIALAAGRGLELTEPVEGRVSLYAKEEGLLKIHVEALYQINGIEDVVFSTLHTNQRVAKNRAVAGTRIIPLITQEEKIRQVEAICGQYFPVIEVKPFIPHRIGIVTTGSEIYKGRIEDRFGPILHSKFRELGSSVIEQTFVSDDVAMTVQAIHKMLDLGAGLIVLTGGMSVDPDDRTPVSIKEAGADIVIYGSPIFPGAMFMLAYIGDVPVVGLPGCVMYYKASIFDLIVPRILAGDKLTRQDIISMGHGGFCSNCPDCRYPVCGFGKGT